VPSPSSSPLPGRGGYGLLAVDVSGADREMASPSAGRAPPAPSRTPASATAKSGSPAAGSSRVGGALGRTGVPISKDSTAATPRAGGAAASAPATPAGATKSSGAAVAASRGNAAHRARPANAAPPRRESSAAGSQATQPPPPPRRYKSTAGSASACRASSAPTRSAGEDAAGPRTAAARVPLPPSWPATPPAAEAAPGEAGDDPMEQESPPPVPRRGRLPAVGEARRAGPGALVPWTPPAADSQMGECSLRTLYSAIPLPKQGPAWQRWLARHPVQYELPAGVATELLALQEAGDAPWVERVAVHLSIVMHGATAGDVPPVVAWEWACCSLPYLGEGEPHFHHQDARTERRVRGSSGILVRASQVESFQVHKSTRRAYYVPTPSWWSALEVPFGFLAWMPRIVAYFGTALRRGESTLAAAILATQWVLEVVRVWYASARTKGYLWHLPAAIVGRLVGLRLANVAEGAGPDAHAYLSELMDLHQSLDWKAAGPYLARRVGGEEGAAPRAFDHCDKRLVAGRIGLPEGLGDLAYPYSAGVTATSPPPDSGWGAPGASVPQQRMRTRGTAERPPARDGAVRRTTRARAPAVGRSGHPTLAPPGVPYYPALGAGQSLRWKNVTPRCAHALATLYPSAAGALRAAHGEAIVAYLVDTLAWVARGAGAVLRDCSAPRSAAAEQFFVDTTPEAIGDQMASRLGEHGQRVAAGPAGASAGGGPSRAPYAGEPTGSAVPYHGGGYPSTAGGYAAAGAAPSRVPRSSWGPGPSDRGSAQEYPADHSGYDQFGEYQGLSWIYPLGIYPSIIIVSSSDTSRCGVSVSQYASMTLPLII